jgi:heme oxygenase (biliverdin-IX-beta and delta-forming)
MRAASPSCCGSKQERTVPTIHAQLRAETAELHTQLENQLKLLGSGLSLSRYRRVLEVFLGFYAPVETRLRLLASAAPPLGVPLQARALLLQRDLLALGMAPGEIADVPQCAELPRLYEPEHLAGCLYVLEGASLGGRVIARALARELILRSDNGAAFFAGDPGGAGMRWKRVLQWLEEVVRADGRGGACNEARSREIVASACETFAALARWAQLQGLSR